MTEAFAVNFCFLGYTSLCTLEQRNRCYPFGVEIFEKVDSTLLHYFKQSIAAEKCLNPCHGRVCSKHWYEPWQITGKGRWHLARAGKWFVLGLIGGMIEPVSPALHGRLLTTEPPGKSCKTPSQPMENTNPGSWPDGAFGVGEPALRVGWWATWYR